MLAIVSPPQEGRLAKALVDTKLAESASMGFQQQHDPGHDQDDAQALAHGRRLLEDETRDRLREQHLDQRERAHAGSGGEREGQEPELRGESAKEPGQK